MNIESAVHTLYIITHDNLINADSGARQRIIQLLNMRSKNEIDFLVPENIDVSELPHYKRLLKFKELYLNNKSLWFFTDFNPFYVVKVIKMLLSRKYNEIIIDFPRGFLIPLLFKRGARLVYSSHGFEFEFVKFHLLHVPRIVQNFILNYSRLQERIVCNISDKIICINERDLNNYILKYKLNKNKLLFLQFEKKIQINKKNNKFSVRKLYGFNEDDHISVFHGSWGHFPNRESFAFIENVLARELPEVKFILAGFGMEKSQHDNIYKLGYIKDIEEALVMADFAVCPIFSGSGTNIKIYDYINNSLKMIISPKAKESLPPDFENYFLCKNAEDYVKAIRCICENGFCKNNP
jgi:hypothetical protein